MTENHKIPSKTLLKHSKAIQSTSSTSWNPKKVFRSALPFRWPHLDPSEEQQVVCLLEEAFISSSCGADVKTRKHHPRRTYDGLVFGFNQVTRLAERGQLEAVFVVRDGQPDILTRHFPWLCFYHGILLFPLQTTSMERLRDSFQLHSLLAMGLKKKQQLLQQQHTNSHQLQYSFTELIDRLRALAP
ncbi:hypothetical protein GAYE_SCF45G5723 [Galdieria yellowstonensis]|uniref:Uncharacterized protein n=1 Tax=Galdieria yellowstonensis TaxID=3028027 RepID=A0AAV9IKF4_9RHOD|nr:hypothetical protein GAYE_SCF45G5723 [Galdieria yellowstonensis]